MLHGDNVASRGLKSSTSIPSSTKFHDSKWQETRAKDLDQLCFLSCSEGVSSVNQRGPQGKSWLCLQRFDRTSDHCQGTSSLCVLRIDRVFGHCHHHSPIAPPMMNVSALVFSLEFKIHCVVPIPQMASLRDFFKLAPSVSSARRRRASDVAERGVHEVWCTAKSQGWETE